MDVLKKLFNSKSFPKSKDVLTVPHETLRSVGLSHQKANYIRDLSDKWEQVMKRSYPEPD